MAPERPTGCARRHRPAPSPRLAGVHRHPHARLGPWPGVRPRRARAAQRTARRRAPRRPRPGRGRARRDRGAGDHRSAPVRTCAHPRHAVRRTDAGPSASRCIGVPARRSRSSTRRHPEPHLTELAHHFAVAAPGGDATKAVDLCPAGRRHAPRLARPRGGGSALRARAVSHSRSTRPPRRRSNAGSISRWATHSHGQATSPRAKDAFLRAASIARSLGDAEALAAAALGYGGRIVWARAGTDHLVVDLLEEALDALGDTVIAAPCSSPRSAGRRSPRRARPGTTRGDRRARSVDRPPDRRPVGARLRATRTERRVPGARIMRAASRSRQSSRGRPAAWVTRRRSATSTWRSHSSTSSSVRLDIVREGTAAMTALAEEIRQPSQLWVAAATRAMLALHEGRYAEAEELIPYALALGRSSQQTMAEVRLRVPALHAPARAGESG